MLLFTMMTYKPISHELIMATTSTILMINHLSKLLPIDSNHFSTSLYPSISMSIYIADLVLLFCLIHSVLSNSGTPG